MDNCGIKRPMGCQCDISVAKKPKLEIKEETVVFTDDVNDESFIDLMEKVEADSVGGTKEYTNGHCAVPIEQNQAETEETPDSEPAGDLGDEINDKCDSGSDESIDDGRFRFKSGASITFKCVPENKVNEALSKIVSITGVAKAGIIDEDEGTIFVLVTADKSLQKKKSEFNGSDWVVNRVSSKTPFATAHVANVISEFFISELLPNDVLVKMHLSEEEKSNLPVMYWLYATLGKTFIKFGDQERVYVAFTYDTLQFMGYYSQDNRHATRALEMLDDDTDGVFVMDYRDALFLKALPNGGKIVNPLNYKPAGGKVLFVEETEILSVLGKCTSGKAKALVKLLSRVVGTMLKSAARRHVKTVGQEIFMTYVVGPAETELFNALQQVKDEKIKRLEAENQLKNAQLAFKKEKNDIYHLMFNMVELIQVNQHTPTKFCGDSLNVPRIGCVGIFSTKLNISNIGAGSKPLYGKNTHVFRLNYSNQRDSQRQRKTLKYSFGRLTQAQTGKPAIYLFGGINPIVCRNNFEEAFGVAALSANMKVRVDSYASGLDKLMNGVFISRAIDSFAFGLYYDEFGAEKPKLAFKNEIIMKSMPEEDINYCNEMIATTTDV